MFFRCRARHKYFNSHAHEGRDVFSNNWRDNYVNFNSHAHEGRDTYRAFMIAAREISTHTLTRGVTNNTDFEENKKNKISTHTPTRGVTL